MKHKDEFNTTLHNGNTTKQLQLLLLSLYKIIVGATRRTCMRQSNEKKVSRIEAKRMAYMATYTPGTCHTVAATLQYNICSFIQKSLAKLQPKDNMRLIQAKAQQLHIMQRLIKWVIIELVALPWQQDDIHSIHQWCKIACKRSRRKLNDLQSWKEMLCK